MDAKKALFRAKLREAAQKRDKRIDSPLVRYNDHDQPVCAVCNVTLKSESIWPAHQVSKKHREAIENVKALAAARDRRNVQSDQQRESDNQNAFDKLEMRKRKTEEGSTVELGVSKSQLKASSLTDELLSQSQSQSQSQQFDQTSEPSKRVKGILPEGFFDSGKEAAEEISGQIAQRSNLADVSEGKQVKGAVPEGFFDNKDADLRARGIQPVKVDISDSYKEFEKEIQEDLLQVDDRLEEEEIDAAEVRQEFELLEQREYRERVEMVKQKLMEAKAAKNARGQKQPSFAHQVSSDESSTDEEEATFAVDWRAKHL